MHVPDRQASSLVAGFPSSQDVYSRWKGYVQLPVAGSRVPATRQAGGGGQSLPAEPAHVPLVH
jgi:hypothetical protein